jgi:hypothetical protein
MPVLLRARRQHIEGNPSKPSLKVKVAEPSLKVKVAQSSLKVKVAESSLEQHRVQHVDPTDPA